MKIQQLKILRILLFKFLINFKGFYFNFFNRLAEIFQVILILILIFHPIKIILALKKIFQILAIFKLLENNSKNNYL